MRGRGYLRILIALMLPLALIIPTGCGGGGGGAIKEVNLKAGGLQEAFSLYYPVPFDASGHIAAYQLNPDLSNVSGLADIPLPPGDLTTLAQRGFMVAPSGEEQIYDIYQKMPGAKFVTVDSVLQAFRFLNGYTLLSLEKEFLMSDLEKLVRSLYLTLDGMYQGAQGTVQEAALKDLGFMGVAARLLEIEVAIPPQVADAVDKELKLIAAHQGPAISPLFNYEEDYSDYLPTGYYANDVGLERYFKSMTWMREMGFYPRPGTTASEVLKGRNFTRQALLLVAALHKANIEGQEALKVWDRIYQPAALLSGVPNELNVYTYGRLAIDEFGKNLQLSRLGDDAPIDSFIEGVLKGTSFSAGAPGDTTTPSFTLFAPRPDVRSKIFERLVEPSVPERTMPRGLDVPAAYGSDRALDILDVLYKDTRYEGYANSIKLLRRELMTTNPVQSHSSVYLSTIDALFVLLKPCGEGHPGFMRNSAWQDKDLHSYLSAWTELEKQALDYNGQPYPALDIPANAAPSPAKGYVEPRPEAFALLAATTDTLKRGLSERGLGLKETTQRLELLNQLLKALKGMAEKELHNEGLSAEEYQIIAGFGETLKYLTTFPVNEEGGQASESAYGSAVVDLYTDPGLGETLQAAIGRPFVYYVVAPVDGKPTLTVGAGFSYYEFLKATDQRVTDAAWRQSLSSGDVPNQPAWALLFLK